MAFCQSIAHLFTSSAAGRKLPGRKARALPEPGQPEASVAAQQAGLYVEGLMRASAGERNLEDIAGTVNGGDHQRIHHFIANAPWDESGVLDWVSARADGLLGGTPQSGLLIDESGFSKKGDSSAGVARQYNGRLGKVDNCQVGVFAALCAGSRATLLEGRLYLPKEWCEDPGRCKKAKIPEDHREFKTKSQMALEMVRDQRLRGVRFHWVGMDAGYGKDPALLRALDADGETFVVDVHASQRIWTENPWPAAPQVRTGKRLETKVKAVDPSVEVREWAASQPAAAWVRFKRREGINGALRGAFLHARVWLWNGKEEVARHWHLVVWKPDEDSDEVKYVLSNAPADIAVIDLARMAASRYWVERALQDAKGAVGMGEYQLRGWIGWHHHMALVMLAMLFMLQQKILLAEELPLLSAEDIVWIIERYLPKSSTTEAEIQAALARRHKRRQIDIDSKKRREETRLEDFL